MKPWLWFALCLVSRLALPGITLEGWDGVNFAESLSGFDLDAQAPHFPGYPLYVLLSSAAFSLVQDECLALILPAAILGSLAVVPLHGLGLRLAGPKAADLAALLYVITPLPWLSAVRPAPDAAAVLFPVWGVLLLLRGEKTAPFWGGFLLGFGLGVRPSNLPAAAVVLLPLQGPAGPRRRTAVGLASLGAVTGVAVWALPYALDQGGVRLWNLGRFALHGHLTDWGGSIVTRPDLAERGIAFVEGLWARGLGGWWPGYPSWRVLPSLCLLAGAIFAIGARGARSLAAVLFLGLPYGLWVLLGQNLDHARHVLPIVPFAILWAAVGLARIAMSWRWGCYVAILTITILPLGIESFGQALDHHRHGPAQVQFVEYVASRYRSESVWFFGGQTARIFDHDAPYFRVSRARAIDDVRREIDASLSVSRRLLVSSEVTGADMAAQAVAVFEHDPRIFDPPHRIALYEWDPASPWFGAKQDGKSQ